MSRFKMALLTKPSDRNTKKRKTKDKEKKFTVSAVLFLRGGGEVDAKAGGDGNTLLTHTQFKEVLQVCSDPFVRIQNQSEEELVVIWADDGLLVSQLAPLNLAARAALLTQPFHPVTALTHANTGELMTNAFTTRLLNFAGLKGEHWREKWRCI
ncbi:hypothetical protein E2C01_029368 [Portunus trituberculatus]|uniref:Uncharacterized protein n=1 Tax=Portunus trituberculatus TaxID=210409 RepID=A0A5B7ES11_PORTR|nr:hypothetical protein [Portunus trituberculatus]